MLSAVFLLNKDAIILIEKQYRDPVSRSELDAACLAIRDRSTPPPSIMSQGEKTVLLHQQDEIWVVGVCDGDEFALLPIQLLAYIGKLLATLLRDGATEISIKSEYPAVYQILDYAIDFGFPFLNESNTILTLLTRPPTDFTKGNRLLLDLQRPWRAMGVKRPTNEILVDIIEKMDVAVSSSGRIEFCHIHGRVDITSHLSDTPYCKLLLTPSTNYEDATFHRCVEIEAHGTKVIPFVPPEGPFNLMSYRINTNQSTIPVWLAPKFVWTKTGMTFEISLKPDATLPKPLELLEVRFELPEGVSSPTLLTTIGRATYEQSTREVIWLIGLYDKKEQIVLNGSASNDSTVDGVSKFPVVVCKFITAGYTPSGFRIERLDVEQVDYACFKGVKYICQSGNYEFRTGFTD